MKFINIDQFSFNKMKPSLITPLKTVDFMYGHIFKLYYGFPLFIPFYEHTSWNKKPEIGNRQFDKINKQFRFLLQVYTKKKENTKKAMKILHKMTKNINGLDKYITLNFYETMDNLNTIVLLNKKSYYFPNFESS